MRAFNTMGTCDPLKHYLVDLTDKVHKIKELVNDGKHFSISKARRYGKTTTLSALKKALSKDYTVLSVSFEGLGTEYFETGRAFVRTFLASMFDEAKDNPLDVPHEISFQLATLSADEADTWALYDLMTVLRRWCRASARPFVLIIDCIDTATDSQAFRDFLSMLRADFNRRTARHGPALRSVIFSGVEDVRFLPPIAGREDNYMENSPFNIASDFPIDMALSEEGIKGMLDDYEADHGTGMYTKAIAKAIREWTNGYPFLVSRICQLLDERAQKETNPAGAWTTQGVDEAVRLIISKDDTLLSSLKESLNNYPELKAAIRSNLMEGMRLPWCPWREDIASMRKVGLIRNEHFAARIDNRLFETMLYDLFLSEAELKGNVFSRQAELSKDRFTANGTLDVPLLIESFIKTYAEVSGPLRDHTFTELFIGREQFLLYLRASINGCGSSYVDADTRDPMRTDVVVDCLGHTCVIGLRDWRSGICDEDAEGNLRQYLDVRGIDTGHLLIFDLNEGTVPEYRQVHAHDTTCD